MQRVSPNSGYIDCYGICIANSQKISITNSAVGGGQHAITTGGSYNGAVFAIPCREIFITNNSIYNENAGSWASIGFHPNTEYCIISGNTMGGIALVGGHMTVTNNIFKKQTNSDISISLSSLLNYNFVIEGNQMVGGISMLDMADLSSYPNITPYSKAETLSIKNNIGVGYCYMIGKHDAINAANAKIEIEGNSFTNTSDDYFGSNVPIRIANNEFFGRILVPYSNGIEFNDNRFAGASKLQFGVGNITGTLEDVSVKNNIFNDTDAWSITMSKSCDNLYVEGNVFKQYKALYLNTGLCQNVTIDHNIFAEEFSGNYYRGDCSKLYFGGQRFLNGELNTFDSHNDISAAINLPIKEVNIIYPKFGTTANRPSLPLMYKGYGYYDETISKQLFYAPAKLTQLLGLRHEANTSTPILTQNTLASGMYFVTTVRAGRHVLAFSKTNTATDIADIYNSDMMIVIDAAVSAAFETSIIAPDPNVYPYIYSYINATSIEVFRIYSAKGWVEADGATAGVLRSGTTAQRPTGGAIYVGYRYFDTTLGKPIFAKTISGDTVTWVDATGTTV